MSCSQHLALLAVYVVWLSLGLVETMAADLMICPPLLLISHFARASSFFGAAQCKSMAACFGSAPHFVMSSGI